MHEYDPDTFFFLSKWHVSEDACLLYGNLGKSEGYTCNFAHTVAHVRPASQTTAVLVLFLQHEDLPASKMTKGVHELRSFAPVQI